MTNANVIINDNVNDILEVNGMPNTNFEMVKGSLRARVFKEGTKDIDVFRKADVYGFDDLIIVPYIVFNDTGAVVDKELIENVWGKTVDEVIDIALQNTEYRVTTMEDILGESLPGSDLMIIVTTPDLQYGAIGAILAKKKLKEIFPNGYVVLPSSVHEVIVIPDDPDIEYMANMIQQINATCLKPEDVLSDHPYRFEVV